MDEIRYSNFVGLDVTPPPPENALFHIIPAPYEKSVSYGKGTSRGPAAILNASNDLELFDGVSVPSDCGIFTHPPVDCSGLAEKVLENISLSIKDVMSMGKIPVLLGGEHTVTYGALKAITESGKSVGVVQFDAHADLRESYQNNPLSHACIMRRALDLKFQIFQIGVRSLSSPEDMLRKTQKIGHLDATAIANNGICDTILPEDFPKEIYLTFDVDVFDSSILPATGTPEPGGLNWFEVMGIFEQILKGRTLIGLDIVEFSPIEGFHAYDFMIARLIYNLFGLISRERNIQGK